MYSASEIRKNHVTLAVDAMGGDNAPQSVIDGIALLAKRDKNVSFIVFGTQEAKDALDKAKLTDSTRFRFRLTQDVIANDDKPSVAVRSGRKSSMWQAILSVKEGVADAVISAGNTGALMAISKLVLRALPGIDRPAIISAFPTLKGSCVLLDLGANIVCDADNLVQFAVMGDAFAKVTLGIDTPKVALLNVGSEDVKGSDVVKAASEELRGDRFDINYIGYVEGDDITAGTADVIVTDGFTGNVALKTAEGTGKICMLYIRQAFSQSIFGKICGLLAKPFLKRMFKRLDPRGYNGAMFVGLGGVAVKSHGNADAKGFERALTVAADLAKCDINGRITEIMRGRQKN